MQRRTYAFHTDMSSTRRRRESGERLPAFIQLHVNPGKLQGTRDEIARYYY